LDIIRTQNYQKEAGINFIASNDFSLCDNMLDTAVMLGAIPKRFQGQKNEALYFSMARGNKDAVAMEMTKWFNTNLPLHRAGTFKRGQLFT
jgi:5-methyltetrahydropteroyltriglutamate--homocysteine methyltransferase